MSKSSSRACRALIPALATVVLMAASMASGQEAAAEKADIVFVNGNVYTVDSGFSVAEAVAIKGNRILAVGTTEDVLRLEGPSTRRFDLAGRTVVPGLIDAHAHLMGYSLSLDQLDLVGTGSAEEIAGMVAAKAEELGPGQWVLGRGWDQNDWPMKKFPTHDALDKAAPDNPVLLRRIDGHACWANAKAMEIAGVSRGSEAPSGGEIIRDEDGDPSGVFVDAAMSLVSRFVPDTPEERRKELLIKGIRNCLEVGLVGNHEMGGGERQIALMRELIEEDNFNYRVYFLLSARLDNLDELLAAGPKDYGDGRLVVRAVKGYIDGALGSRGAALLEPYSDRPESTGLLRTTPEEIQDLTERCLKAGFQVGIHAIGDKGNRIVLDAYEKALKAVPREDARLRIEHAQIISLDDIPRFRTLGVLPSMQPTHATSDLPWAVDRLGTERIKGAYAWRKLLDTGVIIPCGSDFPVERIDPISGFYAAVTRQHEDGTPEGGYYPEERMSRQEALKGFTIWAARAAFAEKETGSLEKGKRADLVVLDRDIMKVPENEILGTKVTLTMVDGKIAFERNGR